METGHLGTRGQYLGSVGVSALLSSVREADSNISAPANCNRKRKKLPGSKTTVGW